MCGDQGLAQAEAAIAARHFGVRENVQAFGFELSLQVLEQENILEGAAAETNILEAGLGSNQLRYPRKHIYKPFMESAAEDARRHATLQVVHQSRKQRSRIDNPAASLGSKLERIAWVCAVAHDGGFEFNGRLGLVIDPLANSCQSRHGIEQAAAARGQGRVDAALGHADEHRHLFV
jgi:hypothetical protein